MFTFLGEGARYCDGMTRRALLQAGALGLGGLTLADLLRLRVTAKESGGVPRPHGAVIYIELGGGPSHFETYDPKPSAPVEFRGPLDAVATNIPGEYFSHYMREQAQLLDKIAIVRSVHHGSNSHDPSSHLTQTGYLKRSQRAGLNEMPCFGAVAAGARSQRARAARLCGFAAHHAQRRRRLFGHGVQPV